MAPTSVRARLLALAVAAAAVVQACGTTFQTPAAVVQGSEITDGELRHNVPLFRFLASLRQQPCASGQRGESSESACSRFTLSQLITQHLVQSYAGGHGVTVSHAEVVSVVLPLEQHFGGASGLRGRLAGQHLTIPDLYGLVQRLLLVQKVARVIAGQEISDRELRSRYAQERLQFTVLHAAHIMLRDRRTAAKIANEATPSNFARLARRSSTDTATASRGGDLGAIPATQLASTDPAFLRAALALRPGQISGPVRTSVGWEVIRLISTRLIPFSRAREQLLSQLSGSAFTSWLQRRFRSGGIDVNPRYGRLDPRTELVEPITCTAATPAPGCAAT